MKKFSYDIDIEAASEGEAEAKLKALSVLGSRLKTVELERLAHIVKNDPIKTALAKKYLGVG
jgi:hypothetical protein